MALAAAAVLVPLGTSIANAAESTAAETAWASTFEGSSVGNPAPGSDAGAMFIGGTDATVSEYAPIIAGIRAGGVRPEGQTCTGELVAPRKILIAAHCADAQGEKSFVYGLNDLKEYKGGAGTGFQFAKAVTYKKHPKYVSFDQGFDVAVVTLDRDITPLNGTFAKFATSADKDVNLVGRKGLGFGYGKKDVNDDTKDVTLDKAELPIVQGGVNNECSGSGSVGNFNNATMICAGTSTGRPVTVLPGDSGGPLLVDGKIYGLASWGKSTWDWWNVYARLNNEMGDWVKTEVGPVTPTEPTVSVTPSTVSVKAGSYASATVNTVAGSGGAESLKLAATGLPSGVQAVFQPTDVTAGGTAKVTFDAAATAANGTSTVTVTATNAAGKAITTTVSLTVTDGGTPTGDFKVSVDPTSVAVNPGEGTAVGLSTVAGTNGPEEVNLTAKGAPSGVTVSFSPSTVQTGEGAKVIIETTSSAAPGTYPVDLNATNAGGKTATATLSVTIKGGTPGDHAVALNPSSVSVNPGGGASTGLTTTAGSGGAEELTLSASGQPSGTTVTFQPTKVAAGEGSKVVVQTASSTPAGTHTITVTATNAAGKTATAALSLTVNGSTTPFSLGASPSSVIVKQGANTTSTISTTAGSGGAETINLTASGQPSGVTASFSPSSVQTGSSSTLTLSATSSAPVGTYTVTVTGTNSSGKTATTTVSLKVESTTTPGGVTVTLSPSSGSQYQGGISEFYASALGGTGNLTFTASGVPAGAQVYFNPATVAQGGRSLIWVFTNFQTPMGTHPITITARSADGKTGSATYSLTVTSFSYTGNSAGRL